MRPYFIEAMRQWEAHTCIRFEEANDDDKYYLYLRTDRPGCFSFVGRQTSGFVNGQDVNLGKGCDKVRH